MHHHLPTKLTGPCTSDGRLLEDCRGPPFLPPGASRTCQLASFPTSNHEPSQVSRVGPSEGLLAERFIEITPFFLKSSKSLLAIHEAPTPLQVTPTRWTESTSRGYSTLFQQYRIPGLCVFLRQKMARPSKGPIRMDPTPTRYAPF